MPSLPVAPGQFEHRQVQGVEPGQRDELELVAHRASSRWKRGDRRVVEVLAPIEGRRAVVGQHLARELRVDRLGELPRLVQVGLRGLAPQQVGIRRVGDGPGDGQSRPPRDAEEAFGGALAGEEAAVALVDVGGDQACARRRRCGRPAPWARPGRPRPGARPPACG